MKNTFFCMVLAMVLFFACSRENRSTLNSPQKIDLSTKFSGLIGKAQNNPHIYGGVGFAFATPVLSYMDGHYNDVLLKEKEDWNVLKNLTVSIPAGYIPNENNGEFFFLSVTKKIYSDTTIFYAKWTWEENEVGYINGPKGLFSLTGFTEAALGGQPTEEAQNSALEKAFDEANKIIDEGQVAYIIQ
ncbi:MAG: hypothetical protein ACI83D_000278 [Planctomycetota bacterium]|jgi:hypothetical protein